MPRHSRPMLKYYYNSDMDRQIDQNFENACNSGCNCNNCPCRMRAGVYRRQKKGMYCFMIFMLLLIFFSILYLHPAKN
jgi:hypothetical protein